MIILLIAAALLAGVIIFAYLAIKQKRSAGKLAAIPTAIAILFAIAFCVVPASIHIVETGEMVKELTKNNGEKFWSALIDYYSSQDTARKRYYYSKLSR